MPHPLFKSAAPAFLLSIALAFSGAKAAPGTALVAAASDSSVRSIAAIADPGPSESKARSLAWAGTLVPLGIGAASAATGNLDALIIGGIVSAVGLTFGPSAGQFYAHSPGRALGATAVRGLGGGLAFAGFVMWVDEAFCGFDEDGFEPADRSVCKEGYGSATMLVGAILLAGGAVFSITDAAPAARRYQERRQASLGWSPTLKPGPDGRLSAGATAWMRF